ncbi:type II secretion system protein [Acetobacterium malicum]|uniref:type II secretion system protein n=1 Tax=Acetobacterium malicum TaxID=52692 RepID=UPI0003F84A64|nr:type II secretion system protein [Acetobacterium dehalogenans]
MELINRIRKSRKGFTLVEIIVVLVILAILAAFTIPAMLGFVNDARGKAYVAEARTVYVAAQSAATEFNATFKLTDAELSSDLSSPKVGVQTTAGTTGHTKASYQMYKYLSEKEGGDFTISTAAVPTTVPKTGSPSSEAAWTVLVQEDLATVANLSTGKVLKVEYVRDGYKVTIESGNATVEKLPKATT